MTRVMFVDTDKRVVAGWVESPYSRGFETLGFEPFVSIKRTSELVMSQNPDVVVIAPILGDVRGMDVFHYLREQTDYPGNLTINGPRGAVNSGALRCTPEQLSVQLGLVFNPAVVARRVPRPFGGFSFGRPS